MTLSNVYNPNTPPAIKIVLEGGFETWVTLAKRPEGMAPPIKKAPKKGKRKKGSNTSAWSLDGIIIAGHDRNSMRHFLKVRGVPPHHLEGRVMKSTQLNCIHIISYVHS